MKFTVLGLSGHAGVGKDYVGTHYLHPQGWYPFSLAWHFKVAIVGKHQATYEEVFKTKPPQVRTALQKEGTELGRNVYGENIWCETMGGWMHLLHEMWGVTKFYVPDVRFPNEVRYIQNELKGRVYRINAPIRESQNGLTAEQRQHPSETSLNSFVGFDGFIDNNPGDEPAPQLRELMLHDQIL